MTRLYIDVVEELLIDSLWNCIQMCGEESAKPYSPRLGTSLDLDP